MRITEGQLRLLVRETLLTENVREGKAYLSLIEKFPNLEGAIGTIADHKKAGSTLVKWLFSRFIEGSAEEIHPIEDVISPIRSFANSFEKIESKWRSSPEFKKSVSKFFNAPEWARENSILAVIPLMTSDQIDKLPGLASREKQEIEINVSEEEMESDRVGKVGPWNLWMPTTRERSCAIAGYDPVTLEPKTTWCTARMAGSNLFYNYVGRPGTDMTLFYVIKDNPESNEDWLSVGFINGKPSLDGKDGGISVDRANNGLIPGALRSILGPHHDKIMEILTQKNKSLGGKHPARQKILDAAQSIEAFHHIMKGLSKAEALDMRELIAQEDDISPDVLDELANTKTDNEYFLAYIAKHPNTPPAALARMAAERGQYIEEWVARHPNTPPETLEMLAGRKEFYEYGVRYGVALNPNTPSRTLRTLARDEHENIRALVAARKDGSVPDDVFDLLADDREEGVLRAVAANEAAPDYVLSRLAKHGLQSVRRLVAANPGAPLGVLENLAYDREQDIKIAVAKNARTPIKTLEMLAADLDDYINMPARATLHRIRTQQEEADASNQTVSESLLRRIIREGLLREAMMTPEQADSRNITFRVNQFPGIITIEAIRWDEEDDPVGLLRAEKLRNPCWEAWEITKSNVSSNFDGLGPLLYELMIDLVHPDPLTSDRASVSRAAKRVWDYYMQRRDDIESLPLDNMRDERTPGVEEDNCGQNSALMWSSEEKPWHSLSLARAYKRKGGGTPIWDALVGLDIIDMFASKKIKERD